MTLASPSLERAVPRPPGDASLAALLLEIERGVEEAFTELYRLTRRRLHAVVLRVIRSPELAGEVTQEAYLEIWQHAGRYRADQGSAMGWMATIAHRRAIDRVRSVTRAQAQEQRYVLSSGDGAGGDSWDDVTARLDAAHVHRFLGVLSSVQREALTLTYLEQRSASEVAELLRVPLGTVKSRTRDGLIRLRSLLAQP
jgi:RNA polymerase sigma-70 factor, ECF subfamily